MDNCPTHHHEGGCVLRDFLNDLNIEPVYSPDFNPAEYVFGKLRTVMKCQFWEITKRDLKESLYTAVDFIAPSDMEGFFSVTGYLDV